MNVKATIKSIIKGKTVPVPSIRYENDILKDRIALITGGGSGIGLSIAEAMCSHGCKTIIAGRNKDRLNSALSRLDSRAEAIVINVDNIKETSGIVEELFNKHGKIDILVNSAGIHHSEKFGNISENEFDAIISTNIKGTYFISQTVSNHMIEKGIKGNILNISSTSGARPAWGPYQISKWAIEGMTKGFADKLYPHQIVVNAIAPGPTATSMLGVDQNNISNPGSLPGRYIMPVEVANIALFLVSDFGRMIVGETVYVSGGSGIISLHK